MGCGTSSCIALLHLQIYVSSALETYEIQRAGQVPLEAVYPPISYSVVL